MTVGPTEMNWFNVIAGLASVGGLIFSYLAWRRAQKAAEAAEGARKAVTVRTLADELQMACVKADQLLDFIAHDRHPEASLWAQELASVLGEIPLRRSPYLSEERKNALLGAREYALSLNQVLASGLPTPVSSGHKHLLIWQSQKISMVLRENLGTIKGEIDTGAKQ